MTFSQILKLVSKFVDTEQLTHSSKELQNILSTHSSEILPSQLSTLLTLGNYLKHIEQFVPNIDQVWEKLIETMMTINFEGNCSCLESSVKMNEAWVLLGYLQCWFYALYSPVDPVWQKIYTSETNKKEVIKSYVLAYLCCRHVRMWYGRNVYNLV